MGKKNILWHTVRAFIAIVVIILCITGTYRVPVMAYTGVPVHASSSWIDDTSIYFGNGVGNQDEIECEEGKGEKNWLAKAFAEVLFSMADGLLSLLNKMHLNMDLITGVRVLTA